MITLTNSATKQLHILCALNNAFAVRLSVVGGGCAGFQYDWSFDAPTPDDFVVDKLIVDSTSLLYLSGSTIDFEQSSFSNTWKVINPAATAACGCGTSVAFGGCNE
jgi:iron-sulfur cluster insertion protein